MQTLAVVVVTITVYSIEEDKVLSEGFDTNGIFGLLVFCLFF